MTAPAAEQLTGRADTERLLSDLARGNHFTTRHTTSDGPDQYRYHELFRDFLLTRARNEFDASHLARIRRAAAAALIAANDIEDAIGLLRDAGAWQELATLVAQQAPLLLRRGQHRTLAGWLQTIPEKVRAANGWLLYWSGAAMFPFSPGESRSQFGQAFATFRAAGDMTGQVLAWSAMADSVTPESADFTLLNELADVAEKELLPSYSSLPDGAIRNRFAGAMLVSLLWDRPHHPDIGMIIEQAYAMLEQSDDPEERARAGLSLAFYYAWHGDTDRYDALLDLLRSVSSDSRATPLALICCRLSQAALLQQVNRIAEALDAVEDGLRLARESGVLVWNLFLHLFGVYCRLYWGDPGGAAKYLSGIEGLLSPKRPVERAHYQIAAAWLALVRGDAPQALALAKEVKRVADKRGASFQRAIADIMLAQARRACGDRTETVSLATRAMEVAGDQFEEIRRMAHLLLADFSFADGQEDAGLVHLRVALEIARRTRRVHCPYLAGTLLGGLYARALQSGIEVDFVRQLIREQRRMLPTPPAYIDSWPWPVQINTLGRLLVRRDDQPIAVNRSNKPAEMLTVLIALGGRDVREERLSEILWPDSEGDAAHTALNTTLSRLRGLLGKESIVMHAGRVGLAPGICWVDTWALEGLIAQAANLGPAHPDSERLTRKVVDLYRGPFLGDDDAPWALALRERLRSRLLYHLRERARYLLEHEHHEAAIELFHRGIEIDELAEEFYCGLMKAHLALSQQAEARAACDRCRRALHSAAGIQPSKETEALCRALHMPASALPHNPS